MKIEGEKSPSQALQKALSKLGNAIIGIDEVQNIITPWFIRVLSVAYNTTDIRFVFTGSMIGMSKILTGEGKGEKFSYQFKGKPIIEIEIKPFTFEESVNFLKYGKDTCNINMSEEEIIDASNTYRGIIGWLTYYGNLRSLGYTHRRAQDEVTKIARTIILSEFSSLSEIQQVIIKALSIMKQARWRDLKKVSEGFLRRDIKDWTFNHALKQLINARIVLKENEKYSLIDPLYSIVQ
ncbi:AAA family ATPase [Saccharolobus islandicus]|uniref:AAA family ATPase n=1 Tax=Saccharolobus islandicus TaxID=43080 RepID=UPI000493B89B|nr:ATPase [Sulfolobus islandicus]